MNVSNVSSVNSFLTDTQNKADQRKKDLLALQQALQTGDDSAAQKALADLQALFQKKDQSVKDQTQTDAKTQIAKDMQSLSDALKSGDTAAAQKAFATLQQDLQSLKKSHGGHHHGGHKKDGDADDAASSTSTSDSQITSYQPDGTISTNQSAGSFLDQEA